MADRDTLQKNADAARELALSMYEKQIKDNTITASGMAVYMKLLQTMGLEAPSMNTFTPKAPISFPTFDDEAEAAQ